VLGALFAGQLNSGINAAWILLYLAKDKKWHDRVLEEVESVADRYCSDTSLPLVDRLMQVPVEAWESEFPMTDLVLRESIRLQLPGAAFRKNISGRPIPLNKEGTEVIPTDAYAAFAVANIHRNPTIYSDPETFDPERYFPDRAEDKNKQFGFIGWGVGRRFAKLENNIITAFWMAAFKDMQLVDKKGNASGLPAVDRNLHSAAKPTQKVYINYKLREE
jgi:cytochrome P450